MDHKRTVRPHILLSVYLLVVLVFDVVRIRTFSLLGFPAQQTFYFVAFVFSFGAKLALLVLENLSKRADLKDPDLKHVSFQPEESRLSLTRTLVAQ